MWLDPIQFHAQSSRRDACAIVDVSSSINWSYGSWNEEIGRWAQWLKDRHICAGDRVAILASNCMEHLSLFFACSRLGAALVPLNHRLTTNELAQQIEHVEPRILFIDEVRDPLPGPIHILIGSVTLPENGLKAEPLDLESVLLILFTSGSTGLPKAVMLTAGMLLWNAFHTIADWGLHADDVTVLHTPLFHTGGWNVTTLPLLRLGGALLLADGFEPGSVLRLIGEARVTVFFAVPTMFQMLANHADFERSDLSSLRLCLSGGASLPHRLWRQFRDRAVPIRQGFGLTEVGPNCFTLTPAEALMRPESIGRPMPHSHALIINERDEVLGAEEVGELVIAGPHLCGGYFRNASSFAASLWQPGVNTTAAATHRAYFRTGDLLKYDTEGFWYVVGRKKEMFISGGENIWPGEIERCILEHPKVRDCRVVPVAHDKWGEVGFAYYLGDPISLVELRTFLEKHLARFKHPHYLSCLESFPLLANGKIDRRALQQRAHSEVTGEV